VPTAAKPSETRIVEAEFVAGAKAPGELPPPVGVEIAFAGRSNVGKSSLLNCLMERRNLVRTSSTPGCTRQISLYRTRAADGVVLTLADLPGYGYAKRSKTEKRHWADLIEGYLLERPTLRAVVVLVDVRRGVEPDDRDLLEMLGSPARTSRPPLGTLVVATKLDRLASSARKPALSKLMRASGIRALGFSAHTGTGRAELLGWVRRAAQVGAENAPSATPPPS
jgi:GTP-binding protein